MTKYNLLSLLLIRMPSSSFTQNSLLFVIFNRKNMNYESYSNEGADGFMSSKIMSKEDIPSPLN